MRLALFDQSLVPELVEENQRPVGSSGDEMLIDPVLVPSSHEEYRAPHTHPPLIVHPQASTGASGSAVLRGSSGGHQL